MMRGLMQWNGNGEGLLLQWHQWAPCHSSGNRSKKNLWDTCKLSQSGCKIWPGQNSDLGLFCEKGPCLQNDRCICETKPAAWQNLLCYPEQLPGGSDRAPLPCFAARRLVSGSNFKVFFQRVSPVQPAVSKTICVRSPQQPNLKPEGKDLSSKMSGLLIMSSREKLVRCGWSITYFPT